MSGIGRAIENLVREAPGYFEDILPVLKELGITVVLPILLGMFSLAGLLRVAEILKRIIFPPNAKELHKEGLGCLKKGDDDQARIQANSLFRQSIKKDPKHLPSYLSLIALQLFHEEDHKGAMETIQDAKSKFPKNKDLQNLELDAKAMSANLGHMVLAGSFASPHLEGALAPAKTPTPPYAY